MQKRFFPLALIVLLTGLAFAGMVTGKHTYTGSGLAVVELFTSEGCSSCPSADRTIAALRDKKINNVYILAYHVDYWNRLGWKDSFSSPQYSQRQANYARILKLNSVYTPQVIVNGEVEFGGSDANKLNSAIQNNLNKKRDNSFSVNSEIKYNELDIHYSVPGNDEVLLNFALVQPDATSDVKRGENKGKILRHVNIVRLLKTITAKGSGNTSLTIPKELSGVPLTLISFTQDKNTMHVLAGDEKSISN